MKIITIVGARPQFVKAATVSRVIKRYNDKAVDNEKIEEEIIHTGQHFDSNMSHIFFDELEIPRPKKNLEINSMTHGAMTGRMLEKIEQILLDSHPDLVLVYGDTNSTLAGALAAAKLHIPVAHVEAGLRSYNRKMPEEINRLLTDHISSLLFCPTEAAVKNLSLEGITKGVELVGDVMLDSFIHYKNMAEQRSSIIGQLGVVEKRYYLATVHREESADDPEKLNQILSAFCQIGKSDFPVVMPVHPRTRKKIQALGQDQRSAESLRLIEPVGYLDMIRLEVNAAAIFTDSGGVQKEAYFSQVPCVTLRNETEWIETVSSGWNVLAGTQKEFIINAFNEVSDNSRKQVEPYYGTGNSAEKILQQLLIRKEHQG